MDNSMKVFDSVSEASKYLSEHNNGHGRIVSSRTGEVISQCRCLKKSGCPTIYADDNGSYDASKWVMKNYSYIQKKPIKVLTPNNELKDVRNAVFLAGPSTRGNEPIGWREEFIWWLDFCGFDGVVLNPENPNNGDFTQDKYIHQVEWERKAMMLATRIIFWVPRTKQNLALTTNIEFGEWFDKNGVYVGYPISADHVRYLGKRCEMVGKPVYHEINELVRDVVEDLNAGPRTFFTSDTHFGSERTLELSCRPFRSIDDMDLNLASNWNKTVRDCDTVYHLGDFGDFKMFENLNCRKMVLVKGNYEDGMVISNKRIECHDNSMNARIGEQKYTLVHKPTDGNGFMLYGHVHATQLVKKNGINVGVDCNGYKPVSVERVKFLRNAIENHYDNDVFC